jgi:hypothetical protein
MWASCARSRNLTPELPPWDAVIAPTATKALRKLPRNEQEPRREQPSARCPLRSLVQQC